MKKLLTLSLLLCLVVVCAAQQEAKMLRFPTIHGNDVVFTYGYSSYRLQRIYAVTEPSGDVRVWEPSIWGESWCHIACKIPFKILLTDCK